ncbi:MAG: alkyl sulfatase C-terminal domain-containing protein [Ilumatobacteraceae bacterium]
MAWDFGSDGTTGLYIRHCVAAPTDGTGADHTIHLSRPTWASVLAGKQTFADALERSEVSVTGDAAVVGRVLSVFDHPSFAVDPTAT